MLEPNPADRMGMLTPEDASSLVAPAPVPAAPSTDPSFIAGVLDMIGQARDADHQQLAAEQDAALQAALEAAGLAPAAPVMPMGMPGLPMDPAALPVDPMAPPALPMDPAAGGPALPPELLAQLLAGS